MNPPTRKRQRSTRVKKILLGGLIVSLGILLLALLVWVRHRDFLRSSSYAYVEDYLNKADPDDFYELVEEYVEQTITPYEDKSAVLASLKNLIRPETLSFAAADGDGTSYLIYADGKEAFLLTLERRSTLSGNASWKVDSLTVADNNRLATEIVLEVPHKALATINGIELNPADSVPAPYHALSSFEASLAEDIYCDRYTLGSFFLTPEPGVVLDGNRLRAETISDGTIRYGYPASATSMATITVPYGSAVVLNGIPLTDNHRVASGVPYPFLTRFEEKIPGLTTAVVYQISGLFTAPDVTVTYNGSSLIPKEGTYTYYLPSDMTKTVVIAAPSYATVKLNGYTLSGAEISAEGLELPIMDGVTGYAKDRPYLTEYTIEGLLTEPTISATDKNGYALPISSYYSTDDRLVITCTPSNSMPDREKLTLRTFAQEYVKYIYNGSNGMSANYSSIVAMTPSGCAAYQLIKSTYSSLYKADVHKKISCGTVTFLEYYPYSQTSYSVILKIPFTTTLNGQKYSHEITMDVLYIYSGTIRRIINYKILETASTPIS